MRIPSTLTKNPLNPFESYFCPAFYFQSQILIRWENVRAFDAIASRLHAIFQPLVIIPFTDKHRAFRDEFIAFHKIRLRDKLFSSFRRKMIERVDFSRETREISRARDVIPDFPLLLRLRLEHEENSLSNLSSLSRFYPLSRPAQLRNSLLSFRIINFIISIAKT